MTHNIPKRVICTLGLLSLACVAANAQDKKADDKAAGTLKVKLNYTGSGPVDQKHKIMIFLFDSPDFASGGHVMPFASKAATGKSETVTFSDLAKSPIYIVASYDPTGEYDGTTGPPPSGSSMGMHGGAEGPAPVKIETGKTVQIDLAFDDSAKMP